MSKKLWAVLLVLFIAGCSPKESADVNENKTVESPLSSSAAGSDEIPVFLRKPASWGNTPDFITTRVGGGDFQLSSLRGRVILLNFWSVDCPACKTQMPVLTKLYKKYGRESLEIVGVCLDRESVVKRFLNVINIDYILVSVNQDMANKYGGALQFLPFTLLVDREGNIAQKYVGFRTFSVIDGDIKELLEKTVAEQ
jgi:thiol-disulfide isomerase/thioredoxin